MGVPRIVLPLIVIGLVALAASRISFNSAWPAEAAPAPGNVYHIAILQVGSDGDWVDPPDFNGLRGVSGVTFTSQFIPTSSLTAAGLAPFNVLIIPWEHDFLWETPSATAAIVAWTTAGGTLVVHPANTTGIDPLFAAFGAPWSITWDAHNGDAVAIIDAANPLVSSPYVIPVAGLVGWDSSFHALVSASGNAWHWATQGTTNTTHVTENLEGCAVAGRGSIAVSGQDPEFHSHEGEGQAMTFGPRLIANEVLVQSAGICTALQPATATPQHVSGAGGAAAVVAVAGAGEKNRERVATESAISQGQPQAPAVSAPQTGTGRITAPNTGEAGLASVGGPSPLLPALAVMLGFAAIAGFGLVYRARNTG